MRLSLRDGMVVGTRWAWKETDDTLAFGDSHLCTPVDLHDYELVPKGFAVAEKRALLQVHGLDVTRRGTMRARHVVVSLSWSDVADYVVAQRDDSQACVLRIRAGATGPTFATFLVVVQNIHSWTDALRVVGVSEAED